MPLLLKIPNIISALPHLVQDGSWAQRLKRDLTWSGSSLPPSQETSRWVGQAITCAATPRPHLASAGHPPPLLLPFEPTSRPWAFCGRGLRGFTESYTRSPWQWGRGRLVMTQEQGPRVPPYQEFLFQSDLSGCYEWVSIKGGVEAVVQFMSLHGSIQIYSLWPHKCERKPGLEGRIEWNRFWQPRWALPCLLVQLLSL